MNDSRADGQEEADSQNIAYNDNKKSSKPKVIIRTEVNTL